MSIRDPASGTVLQSFAEPSSFSNAIAFSPSSKLLAVVFSVRDAEITLWDLAVKFIHGGSLEYERHVVGDVLFSPNGKIAASIGRPSPIQLWNSITGLLLRRFDIHNRAAGLVFSADSREIALQPDKSVIEIWGIHDDSPALRIDVKSGLEYSPEEFSPDGRLFAVGSNLGLGYEITLWDLAYRTAGIKITYPQAGSSSKFVFSPDSRMIGFNQFGNIELWESSSGELLHRIGKTTGGLILFSPDSTLVMTKVTPTKVSIWTIGSYAPPKTISLKTPVEAISGIAISPDGKLLAFYSEPKFLFFDAATGSLLGEIVDDRIFFNEFSFSKTGPFLDTRAGSLNIEKFYNSGFTSSLRSQHAFSREGHWIMKDTEPIFWLPPEQRTGFIRFHNNIIMFAQDMGFVFFLRF
ncbi:hypothetical protein AA313_de0206664 [Arthrobotrys entomopaga]|nr:hypothetical protein AA313_de0206664 [Arthrobotrys entomopaga]